MRDIIALFDNQRVLKREKTRYLDLPFFNHSTATDPIILKQMVKLIVSRVVWKEVTKIVSEEEYGGFLAACVAVETEIPFTLAKQNRIHSINGIGITFAMAYNKRMTLHLNGVTKGDNVVIVDDIIDTGGTIIALIKALKKAKVRIAKIIAVAEKVNAGGVERIKKETGENVTTFVQLDASGRKTKVISFLNKKI